MTQPIPHRGGAQGEGQRGRRRTGRGPTVDVVASDGTSDTSQGSSTSQASGMSQASNTRSAPAEAAALDQPPALEIIEPGPLALIEDRGRPGYLEVGVGHSGAADRAAHALGARLVGNHPDTAAIEVTMGGLVARAHGRITLTLTGAPAPATIDERPVAHATRLVLQDGQVLRLTQPHHSLRTYVTLRGGINVTPVLGSRSTDTLSGIGPAPLRRGDLLPLGTDCGDLPQADHAPQPAPSAANETVILEVRPGPREHWFTTTLTSTGTSTSTRTTTSTSTDTTTNTTWTVSDQLDRTGVRITGTRLLERSTAYTSAELPSEGMVPGAIQVPPSGEPVIFSVDHPVTGGYPVIAVVRDSHLDRVAQLRPGVTLQFASAR